MEHGDHGEHRAAITAPNVHTDAIIGAAIKVHRQLGPGLLESAHEACLVFELRPQGYCVERQKMLGIRYDGFEVDEGYRIDVLVNDTVVVELKAIARLEPVHEAQLLSYVRLARKPAGLLINFHVPRLVDGVRRVLNAHHPLSP